MITRFGPFGYGIQRAASFADKGSGDTVVVGEVAPFVLRIQGWNIVYEPGGKM